jgi:hypothetical protein
MLSSRAIKSFSDKHLRKSTLGVKVHKKWHLGVDARRDPDYASTCGEKIGFY